MLGHIPFRKLTGVFVAAMLIAAVAPMASAAPTPSLPHLVASANKDVTAIRQYYFCETASCQVAKSSQAVAALAGVRDLESLAKASSTIIVATNEEGAFQNFRADVAKMINAIGEIASQKTNTTKTIVVGVVYFESAYLQTDLHVLGRDLAGKRVEFKKWSPGVVAATQTLQIDIQLETPNATTSELIASNQGLELIAQSIEAHLNSPVPIFNAALLSMAQLLTTYSADAIHLLRVRGTPAQKLALTVSLRSFFAKFQAVTRLENKLAA